jgi:hypothetical protein
VTLPIMHNVTNIFPTTGIPHQLMHHYWGHHPYYSHAGDTGGISPLVVIPPTLGASSPPSSSTSSMTSRCFKYRSSKARQCGQCQLVKPIKFDGWRRSCFTVASNPIKLLLRLKAYNRAWV